MPHPQPLKSSTRRTLWAYGLLAPALVLFALFIGLPMILAFVIAFKKIDPSKDIGFDLSAEYEAALSMSGKERR